LEALTATMRSRRVCAGFPDFAHAACAKGGEDLVGTEVVRRGGDHVE
jgi:hypothetical protein